MVLESRYDELEREVLENLQRNKNQMTNEIKQAQEAMPELMPCPFCGETPRMNHKSAGIYGDAIPDVQGMSYPESFSIACRNGHMAHVSKKTKDEAVSAWNTRAAKPLEVASTTPERVREALSANDIHEIKRWLKRVPQQGICPQTDLSIRENILTALQSMEERGGVMEVADCPECFGKGHHAYHAGATPCRGCYPNNGKITRPRTPPATRDELHLTDAGLEHAMQSVATRAPDTMGDGWRPIEQSYDGYYVWHCKHKGFMPELSHTKEWVNKFPPTADKFFPVIEAATNAGEDK